VVTVENLVALVATAVGAGSLPAPVKIGGKRQIGPGLGADSIRDGKLATGIGFGFVLIFMVAYYRMSGAVSVVALFINVLIGFALMATAGATLTLPGITGIALTVGMAVDCNIVIFERIREELRLGRNSRAATDAGFEKALWAVLDSNITTMIAGVVLYTYGTGPIRGFAVTLMIGIVSTLLKAYLLVFFAILLRWTTPRVRIDQLLDLGWKFLLPIALVNLLVTAGLKLAFPVAFGG